MASEKKEKLAWDTPDFAQMYTSAEKLTGSYAQFLLERANISNLDEEQELVVLDQACGTGIVSVKLMDMLSDILKVKLDLTCADFADAMVDFTEKRIEQAGWINARAVKADAMDTKLPSSNYTHIFLNFGPMIFPDWEAGLRELHRMLQPGGTLAMSSWEKVGWMPDVRAAFALDPELPPMPEDSTLRRAFSPDGEWDRPEWIRETVQQAGFTEVMVESVPHTSVLDGTSEFMGMVNMTVGMITSRSWSKDEQEKYADRAKSLTANYMTTKYGDGAIKWDWVAILTTAKKPM